jgi:putative oxidoreductase
MTTTVTTRSTTGSTVPRRVAVIARWALQLVLAAQFATGGTLKLVGDAQMIDLFTDIGVGQWLRYLVAGCELAGAIGLLIPRLAALAALGLSALMVGAVLTNVLIGISPAMPAAFLVAGGVIAYTRRAQLRRLIPNR